MKTASENINTLWCDLAIEELVRNGIKYFCISPGSRSSPLTVAVARHEDTQSIVCYDERGASFHALGYARATQRPAAIIQHPVRPLRTVSRPLSRPQWTGFRCSCSLPIVPRNYAIPGPTRPFTSRAYSETTCDSISTCPARMKKFPHR